MNVLVLDVETTGLSDMTDRVIELAIMDYETETTIVHTLINPEILVQPEITELTKIANADLETAPKFAEIAEVAAKAIGESEIVVGYNPWFDKRMMSAEFKRLRLLVEWPRLICAKRIWDVYEPREQRHLTNAFKRFVDRNGFDGAHGALADIRATRHVLLKQIEEFGLQDKSLHEIDPEQATWWGESSHVVWNDGVLHVNFGKHKDKPCHTVDRGYWDWLSNQDFPKHVRELACYIITYRDGSPRPEDLATWAYGHLS